MTNDERTAITLAATHYRYPAQREEHAIQQLGLTPTRYWAHVWRLVQRPDVIAEMPVEVGRLVRLRDRRAAARRGAPDGAASQPTGSRVTRR